MTLTIRLNDSLSKQLAVEELAAQLLGNAIEQLDAAESWNTQNRRRLALIAKSTHSTLAKNEQAELEKLQSALDQQLEQVDNQLLDNLSDMKRAVASLSEN